MNLKLGGNKLNKYGIKTTDEAGTIGEKLAKVIEGLEGRIDKLEGKKGKTEEKKEEKKK